MICVWELLEGSRYQRVSGIKKNIIGVYCLPRVGDLLHNMQGSLHTISVNPMLEMLEILEMPHPCEL